MSTWLVCPLLVAAALERAPAPGRFTLEGTVLDPSRAPVAAGRVTLVPEGPGVSYSTRTDPAGRFRLEAPAGAYRVLVSATGFADAVLSLRAAASAREAREFVLQVARFGDSVTVTASPGYDTALISSATRTSTPLRDVPQSVTVTTQARIKDQILSSVGDLVRYVPGIQAHQGENNRDQIIVRGQSSSADFFLNGVRDDVQYYRDFYNLERVEALKGPNAMVFGRGGGGGVINRVVKEAGFERRREAWLQGGAYGKLRLSADVDEPLSQDVAFRLNAMYERSDSFRDFVGLERYGVNPTVTIAAGARTRVVLGYEHLHDRRVADRGITSFQNRPADVPTSTYYGDPDQSHVRADVDLASALVEHRAGRVTIRNRTLFGDYARSYQNFVPGAASADATRVALSAYNNATDRRNLFNQTDVVYRVSTGGLRHTLLAGAELGRQLTDNFRNTGYFGGTATSIQVPFADPTLHDADVTFRQSATDADNHVRSTVAAAYLQDQLELSSALQLVAGLRFDRFDLAYHNNRNGDRLGRVDDLVSPRAGIVFKPIPPMSLYGSYTVSWLPSSGDQFSSLTEVTRQLEPEKFTSYELGAKWEVNPDLSLTAAVYRLDRTNTRSADPNDPTRIVQTGSQRTRGFELEASGRVTPRWSIFGGYSYEDAFVTSATVAARAGARVAQVPRHAFSLWTSYELHPRLVAALGVQQRTEVYAAIDNTVALPGYARLDAAGYFSLTRALRLQVNVENLLDAIYYVNADNNTNISPGFRRAVRLALRAAF
jgi:catecholate siderophore receptor